MYFNDSFKNQGWEGQEWKVPKRKIEGTPEWKYPKTKGLGRRTSNTLVRTGRLRREVATSLRESTFEKIKFQVNVPYAAVHNYGLPIRGGQMPKRTFMMNTPKLKQLQMNKIKEFIDKTWQV